MHPILQLLGGLRQYPQRPHHLYPSKCGLPGPWWYSRVDAIFAAATHPRLPYSQLIHRRLQPKPSKRYCPPHPRRGKPYHYLRLQFPVCQPSSGAATRPPCCQWCYARDRQLPRPKCPFRDGEPRNRYRTAVASGNEPERERGTIHELLADERDKFRYRERFGYG